MSPTDTPPSSPQPLAGRHTADRDYAAKPRKPRRRNPLARYVHWLHTQWPAGGVEKLPRVHDDGSTDIPGLYIVGDLTGIPLLKFSSDTGAKAVQRIVASSQSALGNPQSAILDLVILGAGVSGMAAALEARKHDLRFEIVEAAEPFATIVNFPKAKPIYTYPTDMTPAGDLQFHADVKESLLDELKAQTLAKGITPILARAERVIRKGDLLEVQLAPSLNSEPRTPNPLRARNVVIAIGRSGNHRKLNVRGEDNDKVSNRLHDPKDFAGKHVLVVGGGDSALETAIALTETGAHVALAHRKPEFSRPKPANLDRLNQLLTDKARAQRSPALGSTPDLEKPSSQHTTPAVGGYLDPFRHPGTLRLLLNTEVQEIRDHEVVLKQRTTDNGPLTLPNDFVFTMIGREPPLDFLRRSGVKIAGDRGAVWWLTLLLALAIFTFIYHWKKGGLEPGSVPGLGRIIALGNTAAEQKWFPYNFSEYLKNTPAFSDPKHLLGTLRVSFGEPGFYYSLAYCLAVTLFGLRRIRRRKTPYVRAQTYALIAIQVIPLFLLPYVLLPWMGNNGQFGERMRVEGLQQVAPQSVRQLAEYLRTGPPDGVDVQVMGELGLIPADWFDGAESTASRSGNTLSVDFTGGRKVRIDSDSGIRLLNDPTRPSSKVADALFPIAMYGHGREYWRAFGLILAWPLFFWNVFTSQPMWTWLAISFVQTFVIIPAIVYYWGKGAYCGWICSCGALAETLGDAHRHKMPHGPFWNRLNLVGQAFLAFAFVLLILRSIAWARPDSFAGRAFDYLFKQIPYLNYVWFVDLLWAGILGVGLYWHFSGRVWCRFACPLAALMHVYARFSRFRILADKKRCISCNVCTSVCHQGIDVMNFANKGLAMADPQCVRCSACVQSCPTGVLTFGQVDRKTGAILKTDRLQASPVQMVELRHNGKVLA